MKFRTYLVYHLLSAALLVVCLCNRLLMVVEDNGAYLMLSNFTHTLPDGTSVASSWGLGVLLIFTTVLMLFAAFISPYQNYALQKRCAILAMLLLAGYYLLLGVVLWILSGGLGCVPTLYCLFPLVAMVLQLLSFWDTRKAEAKALRKAMDFRLRD